MYMKTAVILFDNPESPLSGCYVEKVKDAFLSGGIGLDRIEILSVNDDIGFRRSVEYFKDTADNLIIVNNDKLNFDFKQIICEIVDTVLAENDDGARFLEAVSKAHGKNYHINNAVLPLEATLIPNVLGAFQGFLLEKDGFTVVGLPQDFAQLKVSTDKYILPYFEKKFDLTRMRLTLKYFGDRAVLEEVLEEALKIGDDTFTYCITERFGDYSIDILLHDMQMQAQVVRYIVGKLKDGIYADYDCTLGETLFNLLKIRKLKLSTAESFTGGRVVSAVIANSGASEYVHEGIVCYSNKSKSQRLGIELKDILHDGAVSSITAYRMAFGLLKEGNCDIAISTTGVAGPNPDGDVPVGTAFVGIGMQDGVHTYRLNLAGSREEITERAKNTALFLAIKKIKNMK